MKLAKLLLSKIICRVRQKLFRLYRRRVDAKICTYFSNNEVETLECKLKNLKSDDFSTLEPAFELAVNNFISHEFDLLGTGWSQFSYGQAPIGIENISYENNLNINADQDGNWLADIINASNLSESIRIWKKIEPPYSPIDWQLDIKSGYRWHNNKWSSDIKTIGPLGSDIKVPWELARMQHLAQMAIYFVVNNNENSNITKSLIPTEFRNQILDFIATNPPRFGANWVCTMDVALRVANWLIAYDLLKSSGVTFDEDFERIFTRSIYEHGNHIVNNLEWTTIARGNHYLANIIGLIFVSTYLPCSQEIIIWLAFSIQEYIKEVSRQFHHDGSNFEASTSYHRLSTQMIIYGASILTNLSIKKRKLLNSLNQDLWTHTPKLESSSVKFYNFRNFHQITPLPDWVYERIEHAANFTRDIAKPNGLIPLIGDNDSGFFIKAFPEYNLIKYDEWYQKYNFNNSENINVDDELVVDEEQRNHKHILEEVSGLFGQTFNSNNKILSLITSNLAGHYNCDDKYSFTPVNSKIKIDEQNSTWAEFDSNQNNITWNSKEREIKFNEKINLSNITLLAYEGIGIYLYKLENFYLLIRCGEVGQNGIGGHAHNDQLSIELNIDGKDIITDPGAYVYTPIPELRNTYRSVKSHFAPHISNEEPSKLNKGLFRLKNATPGICLHFDTNGFIGMHEGYSTPVYRRIEIYKDRIKIIDLSKSLKLLPISYNPPLISPRYGMQLRE